MEEQIQKIIKKYVTQLSDRDGMTRLFGDDDAAKEITAHIMEFIEWLEFGSHPFIQWTDELGHFFTDEFDTKRWNINELFEYWINNIKKQ
jgi:hypothetical protein